MPTRPLFDAIASPDLHVTELVDPAEISFLVTSLADQINAFRMDWSPPKRVHDLSGWIADIIIETTAQGASLLEVHIIDPAWTLLMKDVNGVAFIDVDDEGFLWPPIEVTFPKDRSDATWRLCQLRPSTSLTEANVIMVFEDKIVSELREHFGAQVSFPDQTRAEFLQSLVKQANDSPTFPGEVDIRFRALLPKETFTAADLTMSQRLPASATQPFAPKARKHPNKEPKKPVGSDPLGLPPFPNPIQEAVNGVTLSIAEGWNAFLGFSGGDAFAPGATAPPNSGGVLGGPGGVLGAPLGG